MKKNPNYELKTLDDIPKEPFYQKLCLMNARVKLFNKNFNSKTLLNKKKFNDDLKS